MDFMSTANSYPVASRLVTLARDYGPYPAGDRWAEPDEDDAAAWKALRKLPESAMLGLGLPRFLLRPNHTYRIRLVARGDTAEYWCDGERIFTFRDPAPLASGWFGLRTVKSHLEIRNLKVRQKL